ncbi:hypothetical protein GCM10010273_54030 [Streptomyces lavendulocolor]
MSAAYIQAQAGQREARRFPYGWDRPKGMSRAPTARGSLSVTDMPPAGALRLRDGGGAVRGWWAETRWGPQARSYAEELIPQHAPQ